MDEFAPPARTTGGRTMDSGPTPPAALLFAQNIVADAHGDIYELNHLLNQGAERPLAREIPPPGRRRRRRGHSRGRRGFLQTLEQHRPSAAGNLKQYRTTAQGGRGRRRSRRDRPNGGGRSQPARRRVPIRPHARGARCLREPRRSQDPAALDLRSIQLVWNYRNELGDGAMEGETGGGLSRFGRDVIRSANGLASWSISPTRLPRPSGNP